MEVFYTYFFGAIDNELWAFRFSLLGVVLFEVLNNYGLVKTFKFAMHRKLAYTFGTEGILNQVVETRCALDIGEGFSRYCLQPGELFAADQ